MGSFPWWHDFLGPAGISLMIFVAGTLLRMFFKQQKSVETIERIVPKVEATETEVKGIKVTVDGLARGHEEIRSDQRTIAAKVGVLGETVARIDERTSNGARKSRKEP